MKLNRNEKDLQNALVMTLNNLIPKSHFFRVDVNGIPIKIEGFKDHFRLKKNDMVGTSDIIGSIKGRFVAIEVKRKNNKPSTEQETFINKVRESGGIAFVAYSIEDAVDKLKTALGGRQ